MKSAALLCGSLGTLVIASCPITNSWGHQSKSCTKAIAEIRIASLVKKVGPFEPGPDDEKFDDSWLATLPKRSAITLSSTGSPTLLGGKWGANSVQLVTTHERGQVIFRPLLTPETSEFFFISPAILRKTLAANQLSRLLGLSTTAESFIARVDGVIGVASQYIRGEILRTPFDQTQVDATVIAAHHLFEFIVANRDFQTTNFIVESRMRMASIDHDLAFGTTIVRHLESFTIGNTLPDFYKRDWEVAIKGLTLEGLTLHLSSDLTPQEIAALWYRVQIVKEDLTTGHPPVIP